MDLCFKMLWINRRGAALLTIILCINSSLALRNVVMSGGGAVRSGTSVTLRCSYDLEGQQLYSIRWYHGESEFYRFVPKESPPSLVFSVLGLHVDLYGSNDQAVTLKNVKVQMGGDFQCEVSADAPLFHTEIVSGRLDVVDIPKADPLLTVDRQRFSARDNVRANCSSPVSYPGANLTWYLNEEKIPKTHTTMFPINDDALSPSVSFSVLEIVTEEQIQHPRYQVGGTQQEISSSQLKVPSQNPEITEYTAYAPVLTLKSNDKTNVDDREKSYDGNAAEERYNEIRESEFVTRDHVFKVNAIPLKATRVKIQPGSGGVLKLRCEATIYDTYKAVSDVIVVKEEIPHIALVMKQNSAGSAHQVLRRQWFSIITLSYLHTIWKALISGR